MKKLNFVLMLLVAIPTETTAQVTAESSASEIMAALHEELQANEYGEASKLVAIVVAGHAEYAPVATLQALIRGLEAEVTDPTNKSLHRSMASMLLSAAGSRDAARPRAAVTATLIRLYTQVDDPNVRGTILRALGKQADEGQVMGLLRSLLARTKDEMSLIGEGQIAVETALRMGPSGRTFVESLLAEGRIVEPMALALARVKIGG